MSVKCQSSDATTRLTTFASSRPRRLSQAIMPAAGRGRRTHARLVAALLVALAAAGAESCQIGSRSECDKAPFVPGHNLAGEGFDVVRMRRTGAYVINVKDHLNDNKTCTLCPNRFQSGQVRSATPFTSSLLFLVSTLRRCYSIYYTYGSSLASATPMSPPLRFRGSRLRFWTGAPSVAAASSSPAPSTTRWTPCCAAPTHW